MPTVQPGRYTFDHDGDVVVFLIGMRINKLRKVHKWLPTAMAMPKMLRELFTHPDKGMLGARTYVSGRDVLVVQYWRSFEALERFARSADDTHLPAWRSFNQRVGTDGDVGIWHETYTIPAGTAEGIYNNMPVHGLAKATASVPVARKGQSAAYRAGRAAEDAPGRARAHLTVAARAQANAPGGPTSTRMGVHRSPLMLPGRSHEHDVTTRWRSISARSTTWSPARLGPGPEPSSRSPCTGVFLEPVDGVGHLLGRPAELGGRQPEVGVAARVRVGDADPARTGAGRRRATACRARPGSGRRRT